MIGPVASDLAELGFAAAGSKAESHSGSGLFERPTATPATPAARMANAVNDSSAAPLSASAGRVEPREAFVPTRKPTKYPRSRPGRRFARCRPTNGPVAVG